MDFVLRSDLDYMSGRAGSRWDVKEDETGKSIVNQNHSSHDYLGAKLEISRKFSNIEVETGVEYARTINNQHFMIVSAKRYHHSA